MHILQWLPFIGLTNFRDVCVLGRTSVSILLRLRFRTLIRFFFGPYDGEACALLEETSAVVCDAGSLWMVAYPCVWLPADISIICPKGCAILFHSLMRRMGYNGRVEIEDFGTTRPTSSITAYSLTEVRINIIDSADEHIFPSALDCRLSSHMNVAGMDGIVVFYPLLTLWRRYVKALGEMEGEKIDVPEGMVNMASSDGVVGGKCNRSCSKANRRVHDLEGALCIRWNVDGQGARRLRQCASICHYSFHLGGVCENNGCQYDVKSDPWVTRGI